MNDYVCTKCKKMIKQGAVLEHMKSCPGDIAVSRDWKQASVRYLKFTIAIVLAVSGIWVSRSSFVSIAQKRQLERTPMTKAHAAIQGETKLQGTAQQKDGVELLRAPKSGTPCVYYNYLVHREERDSDGDKRWVKIEHKTKQSHFYLVDETGRIEVQPAGSDKNLEMSFRRREGNLRYTEYRIDPGNKVFMFGYVEDAEGMPVVTFKRDGHYEPLISSHSDRTEQRDRAVWSVAKCWGGLVLFSYALALLVSALGVHRLLVYFNIQAATLTIVLVALGLGMIRTDLAGAAHRLAKHRMAVGKAVQADLNKEGFKPNVSWQELPDFHLFEQKGLSKATAERLNRIRFDYALAVEHAKRQREAFPERWLAPLWKIPRYESVNLPEKQQAELDEVMASFASVALLADMGALLILVAFVAGGVTFFIGFRKVRFKRCMENIPTSITSGAAYGLSEFKGVVELNENDEPLKGPLTYADAVYYHYVVREKRGSGKKSSWVTIQDDKRFKNFICRDREDAIRIKSGDADIHTLHRTTTTRGNRSYTETRLEVGDPVYIIGECRVDPLTGDTLRVSKPKDDLPFVISNMTEAMIMRKFAFQGMLLLNGAFAAVLLLVLSLFAMSGSFGAADYLGAALAGPVFMMLVIIIFHLNDLIFLKQRVDRNASNIDVALQKRHDLVPQMEQVLKVNLDHEKAVQEKIADLRSREGLQRFIAVREAYPDLKADTASAQLIQKLVLLENELAFLRQGHNDAVEIYNTRTQVFPDLILAKMLNLKPGQLIMGETKVVHVPPSVRALWQDNKAEEDDNGNG